MNFETVYEIEPKIARWFGIRTHLVVPNIGWGLGVSWELDLAVMTASDYLYEVEIKVRKHDLIRDQEKRKWLFYGGGKIRKLWFAMPEKLRPHIDFVPEIAGILIVSGEGKIEEIRKPVIDQRARKLTDKEKYQLARLGTLRVWQAKEEIVRLRRRLIRRCDEKPTPPHEETETNSHDEEPIG